MKLLLLAALLGTVGADPSEMFMPGNALFDAVHEPQTLRKKKAVKTEKKPDYEGVNRVFPMGFLLDFMQMNTEPIADIASPYYYKKEKDETVVTCCSFGDTVGADPSKMFMPGNALFEAVHEPQTLRKKKAVKTEKKPDYKGVNRVFPMGFLLDFMQMNNEPKEQPYLRRPPGYRKLEKGGVLMMTDDHYVGSP